MNYENVSKKTWMVVALVAVLAVLVVGVWLGWPAYRQSRTQRFLAQADESLGKGDLKSSALFLRKALEHNPANADATRKMAELATGMRSPVALSWWRRAVELQPTLDNKVRLAAVALQIEKPPFPIATQTLEEIRTVGETNVAFHLVSAQRAIRLNNPTEAQAHLQAAGRLEPTNRLHQLNLAVLQLQSPTASIAEAAQRQLNALATDPTLGGPALRSLAAHGLRQRQLQEAEEFSRRLLVLPRATFEDRLQHLTVLRENASAELPVWIERMKAQAATNVTHIGLTAAWLNGSQRAPEALAWLKTLPPPMRDALPVPLAEAECLVTVKDWAGLESRLNKQRWDELEFMRLAFAARAYREQDRRESADALWDRAVNATAAQVGNAVALLQVASDWGWRDKVESLLWIVSKRAKRENWPLETLQREYTASTNTAGLYRVHQAFLERHPESLEVKNNVAMFGLLLDRDRARATALAREVYEAQRTNAIFVSTYALALHLQDKSAEGLKLMEALPGTELQRPEIAAYYAALLSAGGQPDKAKAYLPAAQKATLLPEERRLLAQAHGQR